MQDIVIAKHGQEWKLLSDIDRLEGTWITSEELGKKLGYSEPRKSIGNIYSKHAESFEKRRDTFVIRTMTNSAGNPNLRIFSERGALKIIRYSETVEADKIMDYVFDVFMEANKKEKITKEFVNRFMIEQMILPAPKTWQKAFPDGFGQQNTKAFPLD